MHVHFNQVQATTFSKGYYMQEVMISVQKEDMREILDLSDTDYDSI